MTPEKFWANVTIADDGCWNWTGRKTGNGYGQVTVMGRLTGSHRYAMHLTTGEPIPDGLLVCHHCDNPACINPGHLFIGTPADNVHDMMMKGRHKLPGRPKLNRKLCGRGHQMSGDSVYEWGNGYRKCKECIRLAAERYRQRKRSDAL